MKVRYSAPMLWLNGALAVLVLGGAGAAYALVGNDPAPSITRTATVARGTVLATVSGSGNVELANQTSVDFGTSGKVTAINVTVGQHVTAGQVLATIDPTTADQTLAVAKESLTVAQDNLAKAESPVDSAQQAVYAAQLAQDQNQIDDAKQNLSTAQSNESTACAASSTSNACTSAKNTVTQDTNQVTSAQDSYNTAVAQQQAAETADPATVAQDEEAVTTAENTVTTDQQAVTDTSLTAPSAGTVLSISGSVGQTVSGSSSAGSSSSGSGSSGSGSSGSGSGGTGTGGGSGSSSTGSSSSSSGSSSSSSTTGFIELGDLTHMNVTDDVSESDVAKVSVGQQATVTLNALPNQTFGAKVISISPTSTVVSNVVEYAVTLQFTGTLPSSVREGQSASIDIVTGEASNALYLPSSAITTVGGASVVTVVKGSSRSVVTVTTGLVGDTDTQIVSGLTDGQTVLQTLSTTTGGTTSRLGGAGLGGGGFTGGAGFGAGLGGAGLGGGAGTAGRGGGG